MIQHEIIGDDMQAVILSMGAGDVVRAEAGAMMFMTDAMEMDAKMEGGLFAGLKRKLLSGESFFITYFRCNAAAGRVAFAGPYPGKIIPVELRSQSILCQKDSFLCPVGEIDISIAFTRRLGAGFFGGEGFILQKLEGTGQAFLHSGGTVVPMQLGLFFAALTGPGRVWLQTLPFSRLADRINAASGGDREDVKRDLGGMFGGIGDLIGGDR
jgi:uncharacterized protein (AIM24 family)